MEPRLQEGARLAATKVIGKSGKHDRTQEAAVVMMKPDGAVAALLGGIDYQSSVFNRAIQARRQPGSAFKPFVYLAALEDGISPWDQRDDEAVDINGYQPQNFGGHYYGTLTLADALAHSVNTITVNLAQEVGVQKVVAAAKRAGIASPLEPNASPGAGHQRSHAAGIDRRLCRLRQWRLSHQSLFHHRSGRCRRQGALPPQRAAAATHHRCLRRPRSGGDAVECDCRAAPAPALRCSPREAAGKTGTTQNSQDAWFVGFTTDYVTAVWVGNDDNSPTRGVTGATLPAQIWKCRDADGRKGPAAESARPLAAGAAACPRVAGVRRARRRPRSATTNPPPPWRAPSRRRRKPNARRGAAAWAAFWAGCSATMTMTAATAARTRRFARGK